MKLTEAKNRDKTKVKWKGNKKSKKKGKGNKKFVRGREWIAVQWMICIAYEGVLL
jgi:hypothetical protein